MMTRPSPAPTSTRRQGRPRRVLGVWLVGLALVSFPPLAWAQPDEPVTPAAPSKSPPPEINHVAGDAGHVWIVRTVPPKASTGPAIASPADSKTPKPTIQLLHRGPNDPAESIYYYIPLTSMPTHVAASGPTVWLLYKDRSVQTIRIDQATKNGPRTIEIVQGAPLPQRGTVRFWAADASGPVALIENAPKPKTPDPETESEPEAEPESENEAEPEAEPEPGAEAETPTEPTASDDEETPRLPEIYDRLLNPDDYPDLAPVIPGADIDHPRLELVPLEATGWGSIAAPDDVEPEHVRDLLAVGDRRYAMIVEPDPRRAFTVHVFSEDRWSALTFPQRLVNPWDAVTADGNVFLVMPPPQRPTYLIAPQLAPLAAPSSGDPELAIRSLINVRPQTVRWWAVRGEDTIVIVAVNGDGELSWLTYDVASDAYMASPMTQLTVSDPPPPLPQPMTVVMIAAMMIGMLFLLGGGKREPGAPVYVPRGTRPAGKVRIYAAMIDMAPAVGIAMIGFGILNPLEIVTKWIDHPDEWQPMLPALTAIGIFVLHTTLTELFTGATLGKLLFKVRVVSMSGLPPNVWQVMARNAFKVIELLPPFLLLVVPFVNRFRQRLGDMVSRTLVVAPQKDAQREDKLEDDDLWDDDLDNWDDPPAK